MSTHTLLCGCISDGSYLCFGHACSEIVIRKTCTDCNGKGSFVVGSIAGSFSYPGETLSEPCDACEGEGTV